MSRTSPESGTEPSPGPAAADDTGFYTPDIYIDEIRGRLRVSPFVTTGVSYTDNVDFEADARDDFVYFIQPGVSLDLDAGRFRTVLNAAVSLEYSTDEGGFDLRQTADTRLQSLNRFELVEDILFVDAQAAISRELIDARSRPSASNVERSDDRATVQRYQISPFVQYRFGRFVDNETRLSLGYVSIGGDGDGDRGDGEDGLTYSASTAFSSGRMFNRFQWRLASIYRVEDAGDEREEVERFTNEANGRVALDRTFALLGTVGHDSIEDAEVTDVPDGLFWNVGLGFTPNPRLSATVTYGRRFDNDDFGLDLTYEIAPGSRFLARFEQTLETEEQVFLRDLSSLGVNDEGQLIDTRTGEPLESTADLFGLRAESFRRNRFDSILTLDRRRNTYRFGGFYETREILDTTRRTERGFGGSASWRRQLNRRTNGSIGIGYQQVDFGTADERVDDLYTVRTSLSHNLGEGLSMFFGYVFQHQDSSAEDETATENLVTLSLTKRF
ncbi:MAG: TIGR03016 family PEP-CTERM system-associated outer membrane protein [Alphaproteobacteria bacterium]|nr:TIGR03016 family PEP-CTERM system-associated outer membrane protein [Alphaproteobacteria bacterium]